MHLRRLTLVTFAAPLLFAACSSEDTGTVNEGAERPPPYVAPTNSSTNQPGTGSTSAPGAGGGSGSSEVPNDTTLQPGENPDLGGGNAGNGSGGTGGVTPIDPGITVVPVGTVENRGAECQVPALPAGNTLP